MNCNLPDSLAPDKEADQWLCFQKHNKNIYWCGIMWPDYPVFTEWRNVISTLFSFMAVIIDKSH